MAVTIVRTASSSQINSLLTQASASATYLTQVSASTNYLTKSSASTTYLTQASASTSYAPITPLTQTGFRNLLINGDFRINQRAFTSKGAAATVDYGFDRWFIYSSDGNSTITPQTFSLGNIISGYESSNFLRLTTPITTKATAYDLVGQRIEDVRTLAGQTATISFWAKAGSGTPSVSLELTQNFGTGGSPSADVNTYVNKIALSTSWTRYTMTIAVPSISGKTIGTTTNTSYLELDIWGSAGSDFNSRTNSLGNQNNTFDFWGFQIERGSIATPFEQRHIDIELASCQRYYEKSYDIGTAPATITENGAFYAWGSTQADGFIGTTIPFKVPKRNTTYTFTGYTTTTGASGSFVILRAGALSTASISGTLGKGTSSISPYCQSGANNALARLQGQWVVDAEL